MMLINYDSRKSKFFFQGSVLKSLKWEISFYFCIKYKFDYWLHARMFCLRILNNMINKMHEWTTWLIVLEHMSDLKTLPQINLLVNMFVIGFYR